ncbi:MAG: ABC transporter ATP-binding protein [Mycoplasma sp.]
MSKNDNLILELEKEYELNEQHKSGDELEVKTDTFGDPIIEKAPKGQMVKVSKKIINFASSNRWMLWVVFAVAILSAALSLFSPSLMQTITDEIQKWFNTGVESLDKIMYTGIILSIVFFLAWVLNYINRYIMAIFTQKISKKMRSDINNKIDRLPMSHFGENSTGGTLSIIANDADAVGISLNNSIGTLLLQSTLLIGSLIMMFVTNWAMALSAIAATIIGFVLTILIMGKSQKYFNDQRKWLSRINGHIEESYSGQTIIKVYNGENEIIKKFTNLNMILSSKVFKSQALSSLMMPIMIFIDKFAYVIVIVIGAVLATQGLFGVTFGTIVAFIFYVRYFTQPMSQIAQAVQGLQTGIAASHRVFEFLELKEMSVEENSIINIQLTKENNSTKIIEFIEKTSKEDPRFKYTITNGDELTLICTEKEKLQELIETLYIEYNLSIDSSIIESIPRETISIEHDKVKGLVEFEHVQFGYDKDKVIINDFSAIAKPSQKVAIVGPTGAGKTTLVNLLMRFYEINKGDIKIDGISIHDMKQSDVRKLFCMVLQDTWLFDGTIKENIVYSKEGITDEMVWEVIESVGLAHYVRTLPSGINTVLSSKVSLSEGQKQQITIARAMIQDAPMLILDEATSNVDTRTEIHIQNAMDKLMEKRTSFVIAHRLSTIKNADLILVLKDGDVIESGNHNQLIEKQGFYANLYNSQFQND